MKYPIFDLHCDTAYALLSREDRMVDKKLSANQLHIDLDRAAALPGYCQCFACFTTPLEILPPKMSVIDLFERELNGILNELERIPTGSGRRFLRKKSSKIAMTASCPPS